MFVYVVDRDGELDVYASLHDAREACSSHAGEWGEPMRYVEQVVFGPSSEDSETRSWLDELQQGQEN